MKITPNSLTIKVIIRFSYMVFVFILFSACSMQENEMVEKADSVYFGGNIYSMDGEFSRFAEAVAVKNGKVVYIGSRAGAEKYMDNSTKLTNLGGKSFCEAFLNH